MKADASKLIASIGKYKKELNANSKELVTKLVEEGSKDANFKLSRAEYTGIITSSITSEQKNLQGEISMEGQDAGFIEFGTGVYFEGGKMSHPQAEEFGAIRGYYRPEGTQGLNPPWTYTGSVGSSKHSYPTPDGYILTYGIPANRVMYGVGRYLETIYKEKAKEVFK